jgi:DNA-binding transcriptional LysR family regulator
VLEKETIDLRALRIFERVARLRGVTAAAGELGLPKSAVSKALTRLEERLAASLLERTSRRVSLTEAGRVLLARCDSLLAEAAAIAGAVREVQDEVRGRLVVAVSPDLGAHLCGGLFPHFLERHPDVTIQLALDYGYADLLDPAFDVAFRVGDVHDDRLVARKVGLVQRALVASPAFLRKHRLRSPGDLSRVPALVFSEGPPIGSFTLTDGKREVSVPVRGQLSARSFPALLRAAEAGMGVAFTPVIVAQNQLRRGTLKRVLPRWQPPAGPILLAYRPGHHRIRRVAALIDFASDPKNGVPG